MSYFGQVILLFLLLSCGKDTPQSSQESSFAPLYSDEYISLLNSYRGYLRLNPIMENSQISQVAREHTELMASAMRRFGHSGWKQRCEFLKKNLGATACGEVVSKGPQTPLEALESWTNSEPHREILENNQWTHTGIYKALSPEGINYWTQILITIP